MADPFDVRLTWFKQLFPGHPVVDPSFCVDQFKNAHALNVRNRPLANEDLFNRDGINDSIKSKSPR